jgi:hypothetical protein
MSDAAWNLMMADKYPNWYEHLPKVEAAMAEHDRVYQARTAAGWEMGEEGEWYLPDGTPEWECEYTGPYPEDA